MLVAVNNHAGFAMLVFKYSYSPLLALFALTAALCSCGGGGGSQNSSPIQHISSSASSNSSESGTVTLSGVITYDYIPHNSNHVGLNYLAIEKRKVRGALVELLGSDGVSLASSISADDGSYSFIVSKNIFVRVRVKAELVRLTSPTWDFKITDNTNNNALYVLDGALISTGTVDSQRNLNAASGWGGASYTTTRAAAPFAILDDIYLGANRLIDAGNTRNFPSMELRWSTKNKAADGDLTKGEIGTSYYDGASNSIYILGDANNDTDEYDGHVLLHEWGHYLESNLFRSDSIGGDHTDEEALDMRVSMSEGFANAFSGMMLNDINYCDASGASQSNGFTFNLGQKSRVLKGFFSEGSVGSIFYNYYAGSINKTANDFSPIFQVFNNSDYYNNEAMTSIFLFYAQLKKNLADQEPLFTSLLTEQKIFGTDEYATGETNDAGLKASLPVYKIIHADNSTVNVCSSAEFGKFNKLANSQFLKIDIASSGNYTFTATKFGGADVISKPEFIVYNRGLEILYAKNTADNNVSASADLTAGSYIIEIYDVNNNDVNNTDPNTPCFNFSAVINPTPTPSPAP